MGGIRRKVNSAFDRARRVLSWSLLIRFWSPLWANPSGKYANPDLGYRTSDSDGEETISLSNQKHEVFIRSDELWAYILNTTPNATPNLKKLISHIFSIPCSNSFVESIFSNMKHCWNDYRNRMNIELISSELKLRMNSTQVKDARWETIGSDEFPVISWQQCSVFGSCYRLPLISCRFLCQIWIFGYDRRFHCVSRLSFRLSTKLSESESWPCRF